MESELRPDASARRDDTASDLSGMAVYTRDGYRLGDADGVAVELERERASALLVTDVDESRFPALSTGPRGVRIPYDLVAAVGDVVVVHVRAETLGVSDADGTAASDSLSDAFGVARRSGPPTR